MQLQLDGGDEVFGIGGAELYRQLLPFAEPAWERLDAARTGEGFEQVMQEREQAQRDRRLSGVPFGGGDVDAVQGRGVVGGVGVGDFQ